MSTGVERILTLTFGEGGNEANYLGNGWSAAEPGFRWMIGPASEIWLEHPGPGHDLILELEADVVGGPGGQKLTVGVRDRAIAQLQVSQLGILGFHIPAALIASPGPIRLLFLHPEFRRPMDLVGGTDDRPLSFSARNLTLSRILPRDPPAAAAPPLPPGDLVLKFESLGDNCEFGLAQRNHGAEPLGLLRFAYIELILLLRGLRSGFDGLGEPARTLIEVEGEDREFIVRDPIYGLAYHTFQYEGRIAVEALRAQQSTRLAFLRRKLVADLMEGSKIFVVKRNEPLRAEEILPLYTTINEFGRNWLLWVVPANEANPAGKVELLLPGLLRGYMDHFAPLDNAHDLSLDSWTALCEAAWRLVGLTLPGLDGGGG